MFMDLLVLADSDGVVDMTYEAISRRTNVPIDEVKKYLHELGQPDPASRSKLNEGRRIIPIDSGRGWGWQIVNYSHYREIKDEEARRAYFRDAKRKSRNKRGLKKSKTPFDQSGQSLTSASASTSMFPSALGEVPEGLRSPVFNDAWDQWKKHRREIRKPITPTSERQQLAQLQVMGEKRAVAAINHSIANGWQGIFEPDQKNGTNQKPITESNRSVGTLNEGKSVQYRGVGRVVS